jgi:5,10-methylenetetrahydromethanopterin reductase
MADIGIAIDGRAPVVDIPAQARAAEQGGAGTLWIACHLFMRDPIASAAIALSATTRLKVALMAMSPYSVHPVFIAMAAATLDEMFPGRVVLCLGAGAPADLKAAGLVASKPLATLQETIALCRALFAGETVEAAGNIFPVHGRRLINGSCAIPIVLAASGPHMLALAGRAADGVLISAATSPPFVRACLDGVEKAGRTVRKVAIVYTRVAASEREAMDLLRRPMGYVLRGAHHAENIRLSGAALDQAGLAAAYAAESWDEVDRLVSDDMVRRHAACGTPQQVRARLEDYRAVGLDEMVLGGLDSVREIEAALNAVRSS